MARFSIRFEDCDGEERIDLDLPDRARARLEATVAAAEMVASRPESLLRSNRWRMTVTEGATDVVLVLEMTASP